MKSRKCFGRVALLWVMAAGMQTLVWAANPFLPLGEYIPDGEPRVFGDRVYLYGSHDRANSREFCDFKLKVWSASLSNLNVWRDEGVSFRSRADDQGPDDVPWSDNHLYAPDVMEKGGKYYLYFYVVGAPGGVAVSDTPAGPFSLVSRIQAPPGMPGDFGGWGQYADPGVLMDDDGRVYLYWGYKRCFLAELNPENMYEILPGTYKEDFLPKRFNFFEGASMRKIGKKYYFIYAEGSGLAYCTSDAPTGPFFYGGVIIRNGGDSPGGNIHGSLANLNGQWYIFYHRMTNNTIFSRRACAERVVIDARGRISKAEQTSLGFEESLDPGKETPADIACVLTGGNFVTEQDPATRMVTNNRSGSVVGYKYFDFSLSGPRAWTGLSAVVRGGGPGAVMEIRADHPESGPLLGTASLKPAGTHEGDWYTIKAGVAGLEGRRAIFFIFRSPEAQKAGEMKVDLKSFVFTP